MPGGPPVTFAPALHVRLSLVLLALFIAAGIACLSLVSWSTSRYHQEVTQYLNRDLGMYVAQREPLIRGGEVNRPAMEELARQAMVINPIVEVYLLDTDGRILAHTLPAETVLRDRVDIGPVRDFLGDDRHFPTRGDDPRDPDGAAVFSAFPVQDGRAPAGYVYAVLGARQYESLPKSLRASYVLKLALGGVIAILLFGFSCLFVVFRLLTRPLRQLAADMDRFHRAELGPGVTMDAAVDEISTLRRTFEAMRRRIREQLAKLRETDQVRRELVSNVSHDLRTPLASMQGYLETLTVKPMSDDERQRYLKIVHRHCERLARLVAELFELSKLDLGLVAPTPEQFALAELLQDVLQKLQLEAERRGIRVSLSASEGPCPVQADIAMIERVIENLLDNALRHTPPGGHVELRLERAGGKVRVAVEDSGTGIDQAEIPFIFDRYYRGGRSRRPGADDAGTGLGLAIVKRIVELHDSGLAVQSTVGQGSVFSFELPAAPDTAGAPLEAVRAGSRERVGNV